LEGSRFGASQLIWIDTKRGHSTPQEAGSAGIMSGDEMKLASRNTQIARDAPCFVCATVLQIELIVARSHPTSAPSRDGVNDHGQRPLSYQGSHQTLPGIVRNRAWFPSRGIELDQTSPHCRGSGLLIRQDDVRHPAGSGSGTIVRYS
jgi:hypothetical protein